MFGFNVLDTSYYNTFGLACLSAQSRAMTSNMLTMPTMGLNPFMCGNNYLLDPNFTMWQMQQSFNPGGNSFFGGWNNSFGNNAWWNTMGWNGTPFNSIGPAGGGSSNSSSNSKSSTDATLNNQYTNICSLLDEITKITEDYETKNEIKKIKDEKELTKEEKYKKLVDIYNRYSEERKNLAIQNKNKDKFIASGLVTDEKTEKYVNNFEKAVKDLRDENFHTGNAEEAVRQSNIVAFISCWKDNNTHNQNLLSYIDSETSDIKDNKDSVNHLKNLICTKLIKSAKDIKITVDEKLEEKIDKAIEKLEKTQNDANLNELYVLIRCAEKTRLDKELQKKYGSDINLSMIDNNMKEDLKKEKLESLYNKNKNLIKSSNRTENTSTPNSINEAQADLDELVDSKVLVKRKVEGKTVYEEKERTGCSKEGGSPNYKRVYYQSQGRIYEWENIQIKDNKLAKVNNNQKTPSTEITASEIEDRIDNIEKRSNIISRAQYVYQNLRGYTYDDENKKIEKYINDLNQDNILDFLKAYSDAGDGKGLTTGDANEGLIEYLTDGANINKNTILNVLTSLKDKALSMNLESCDEYIDLNDLINDLQSGKNFDDGYHSWWFFGLYYKEACDRALVNLYNKMIAKNR